MLRAHGVVGKFVEFYGPGLSRLGLADRATISNMSPGVRGDRDDVPDRRRDAALPAHDRPPRRGHRPGRGVRARPRACSGPTTRPSRRFSESLSLDLSTVVPSLAGPKRPQDRVAALRPARLVPRRLPGRAPLARRRHDARAPCRGRGRALGTLDEASDESFPASDPPSYTRDPEAERHASPDAPRHEPERLPRRRALPRGRGAPGRSAPQASDRVGRDRRDHVVHEHEQPDGHGRRRPAGAERGGPRPRDEAVGEDLAGARIPGGDRLPARRPT